MDGSTDVVERSDTSFNEYYEALGETVSHDDNGNMSEDGTYEYEWDVFNRLRRVKLAINGYTLAQYYYDAGNRRVCKTTWAGMQSTDTHYYYDGWRAIEERVSDTPVRQFVFGNYLDEALCMDVGEDADGDCIESGTDSRYYYHQNAIYSVVAITNDDGEIVEAYEYDPYGKHILLTHGDADGVVEFDSSDTRTLLGASALGNSFTFTGQKFDPEAGLHYYKNRYYHCGLGRFVSRDPLGYANGVVNLHLYCGNTPTCSVDSYGLKEKWVFRKQTARVAFDEWSQHTYSGSHWIGRDDSTMSGNYEIAPTDSGGAAIVYNNYWHNFTKFWARSEHIVGAAWNRAYTINQETGNLVYVDGEGPTSTPDFKNYIAYAHMQVSVEGEGTKKVHITVEIKTGVSANVTVTGSIGGEGSIGGDKGAPGGKITLGTSISFSGEVGVQKGTTKDWFIESICIDE